LWKLKTDCTHQGLRTLSCYSVAHYRQFLKVNMWCIQLHDHGVHPSTLKQLWCSPVTSVCYRICLTHRYKNCSLLCSFCKIVYCCTRALLCVHISISMSETNGLAVLVPPFTWPDHLDITSCGFFIHVYTKVCVYQTAVAGTELKLLLPYFPAHKMHFLTRKM